MPSQKTARVQTSHAQEGQVATGCVQVATGCMQVNVEKSGRTESGSSRWRVKELQFGFLGAGELLKVLEQERQLKRPFTQGPASIGVLAVQRKGRILGARPRNVLRSSNSLLGGGETQAGSWQRGDALGSL